MAEKGLRLERCRLCGKSKVKILIAKQDGAAAKRSLLVWFFGISFEDIAVASFKEVEEMLCLGLIEEIIDEDEFERPTNFPKERYKNTDTKFNKIKLGGSKGF